MHENNFVFIAIIFYSIKKLNKILPCSTKIYYVIPIAVTTIAWLSAAVTFYQTSMPDSQIDIQRFFMVLGVAGLIWRIKVYRESSHKKDAIIKEQRDKINHLTAK